LDIRIRYVRYPNPEPATAIELACYLDAEAELEDPAQILTTAFGITAEASGGRDHPVLPVDVSIDVDIAEHATMRIGHHTKQGDRWHGLFYRDAALFDSLWLDRRVGLCRSHRHPG